MKIRLLSIFCTFFMIFVHIVYSQSEELCCTWANTNYKGEENPQKMIFNYDGTFATYSTKETSDAESRGTFTIVEKWKDQKGVVWYKIKMQDVKGTRYQLARITNNGDRLEFICDADRFPKTIDLDSSNYCTYTRFLFD